MARPTTDPMRHLIAMMSLLAIGATGCYYDNEEELYPFAFCDTQNVSWSQDIRPIIQARCAIPGCHVTGAQAPDLTTYAAVKQQADAGRIKARVVDRTPSVMPPGGALPGCDLQQVTAWLAAGAPEN